MECFILKPIDDTDIVNAFKGMNIVCEFETLPNTSHEFVEVRRKLETVFTPGNMANELLDVRKRIRDFIEGREGKFDKLLVVVMPGNRNFDNKPRSPTEWAIEVGKEIRKTAFLRYYLVVLLTCESEILRMPEIITPYWNVVVDYSVVSRQERNAIATLASPLSSFRAGFTAFGNVLDWENKRLIVDLIFFGIMIPLVAGIAGGIGQRLFDLAQSLLNRQFQTIQSSPIWIKIIVSVFIFGLCTVSILSIRKWLRNVFQFRNTAR